MAGWASVPIFQGSGTPTARQVASDGLRIGYNTEDRDGWTMASANVPFCKCAYYKSGIYYYIVGAVKASTYVNTMKQYFVFYYGSYSQVYSKNFAESYGDFLYSSGATAQTIDSKRNPAIPAYETFQAALDALNDGIWEDPGNDPYNAGGESGSGGGTGTFSGTGDDISIPSLPILSAVDAGFITLFNPSVSQLHALATYMWENPLFDISNWKKLFADPMEAILGLSIVPVNVPSSGSANVKVGNIVTDVAMTKAAGQYVTVDCGTLNVNEYWGAYLDYAPYTKAELYLPYCGTHPISVDDIMGKSVHVVYHVDILSGACCAYVQCDGTVLYTFVGQCSCSVPITGNDWTNVVNGAVNMATSIGSMVATQGMTAPYAIANIASSAANVVKPNVEKSGAMGGMGGMLGVQTPYLILTRPRQAVPKKQNKYMGYPAYITEKLQDLIGYTEIESINLTNISATEQETSEIIRLLKEGVFL